MDTLIALPLLAPFLAAIGCIAVRRSLALQQAIGAIGAVSAAGASFTLLANVRDGSIVVGRMGGWPAPFGITLVADVFSALLLAAAACVTVSVVVYSIFGLGTQRERGDYYALVHLLLMGTNGVLLAGDLFNLYVWLELSLIASFALMALGGEQRQLQGTLKYLTINAVASFTLLSSVGLLYACAGTLNLADLAEKLPDANPASANAAVALLLVSLGVKAGVFPLFSWLPASYPEAPIAITALFSGLLTKAGAYAAIRIFTLFHEEPSSSTLRVILLIAAFTMVTGVLGALAQTDLRRLLSFHIVSQIGYIVLGLGLYTAASLTAAIFFTVHIMIAKPALFLIAGVVERRGGSRDLASLGGLYSAAPALTAAFLLGALSLAGVPPLSGFAAKLGLVTAAIRQEEYGMAATALLVSLLTLYSMTKIWNQAFWEPAPPGGLREGSTPLLASCAPLIAILVGLGLMPAPLLDAASTAAEQLLAPEVYVESVLVGRQP